MPEFGFARARAALALWSFLACAAALATVAEIEGQRAIAQTRMSINVRSHLDGIEVDAACLGRFFDRVEKRDGAWRIAKRSVVYEKDRIDPVDPQARVALDPELLGRFPEGYRHLAYLQTRNGSHVNPGLPTASGEALERLREEARAWLAGSETTTFNQGDVRS